MKPKFLAISWTHCCVTSCSVNLSSGIHNYLPVKGYHCKSTKVLVFINVLWILVLSPPVLVFIKVLFVDISAWSTCTCIHKHLVDIVLSPPVLSVLVFINVLWISVLGQPVLVFKILLYWYS